MNAIFIFIEVINKCATLLFWGKIAYFRGWKQADNYVHGEIFY
jgi:hypothetical protein